MHVIWSAKIIHESCGFIMGVSRRSIVVIINAKKGVSRFIFLCQKNQKYFYNKGTLFVH